MRRWHIIVSTVAAASATSASAGAPQVEQDLAFLVGEWTIAGVEDRYHDSCAWFDDRSFVVCDTKDGRHGRPQHHVAVLGWSAHAGNHTYLSYAQDGSSRSETCFTNALKGLTCLGERRGEDGLTQIRTHFWPVPNGLGLRQERSLNGGPWKDVGQLEYIRRK